MKMNRLFTLKLVILSIFIVGLSACQKNEQEGSTTNFKRTDNQVITRVLTEAEGLNSMVSTGITARMITEQLFQYLLTIDPVTFELKPQLAKERPVISEIKEGPYAGGVRMSFEIHEAAKWDDGTPVTGEDYLFSLKTIFVPGASSAALRSYYKYLKEVIIDLENPKKFDVIFDRKYFLAEDVAANNFHVFPKHIYDSKGALDNYTLEELSDLEKAEQLIQNSDDLKEFVEVFTSPKFTRETAEGSGPYELKEWIPNQQIVLARKADWWGDKIDNKSVGLQAYPDEIVFKPIPKDVTAVAALKSEEIDAVVGIPAQEFIEMKQQDMITSTYHLHSPEIGAWYALSLNTRRPKLSDKRVRRALAHAINMDTLIQQAFRGFARRTASPVMQSTKAYNKELQPYPYNPQKARQLLKEAGWEDSNNNGTVDKMIDGELTELSLNYDYTAGRAVSETFALVTQKYAQQVGIEINIVPKEGNILKNDQINGNYDISAFGSAANPTWVPKQRWHSEGDERTGFATAYTDELIDKIEVTADEEERLKLYKELQAIIHEEVPVIFVGVPQNRLAIHKRFSTPLSTAYPGYVASLLKLEQ